jgi:hypothetical protein
MCMYVRIYLFIYLHIYIYIYTYAPPLHAPAAGPHHPEAGLSRPGAVEVGPSHYTVNREQLQTFEGLLPER